MSQENTIRRFLELRRSGNGEAAAMMLAPGTMIACPFGTFYGDEAIAFLRDEPSFAHKEYLKDGNVVMVDNNVGSRKYRYLVHRKPLNKRGEVPGIVTPLLPKAYREIYVAEEGMITGMYCNKMARRNFQAL